jgi:CRISPR/Cas system-associated endonuclease Cas1
MWGFPRNPMGLESSDVLPQKEAAIIFAAAASNRKANNKRNVRGLSGSAPIHEPISPPNPTQTSQRGKRAGNNGRVAHVPARAATEFMRLNMTDMAAVLAGNRNAGHPVNAILNYAYAALESETRIKAISDGYDPTIGIMHEGSDRSSKFIFDLMEPERPKVDRKVLDFVKGHVFDPADLVIRSDGVCRLNPEMARLVVAKVSN